MPPDTATDIKVVRIAESSPELEQVIRLADANRAQLGFLPKGAFAEYAQQGTILIATTTSGTTAGYLLYRRVSGRRYIKIVHLCVDEPYRGKGIAKLLVDHLKALPDEAREIRLLCRRDFKANTFWPAVGFIYANEKPGRGKEPARLSDYRFGWSMPPLLEMIDREVAESKAAKAVIDSNVFFDIMKNGDDHPLMADWLSSELQIFVAPELRNEISRANEIGRRTSALTYAQRFAEVSVSHHTGIDDVIFLLRTSSGYGTERQDESDLRQLAYAITGGVDFFVTCDIPLTRKLSSLVLQNYGVLIVDPEKLITHLDELLDEKAYQANRIAGSGLELQRLSARMIDDVVSEFQHLRGEKKARFRELISPFLLEPDRYGIHLVRSDSVHNLAILVIENAQSDLLTVPLFYVPDTALASALSSYLISYLLSTAVKNHCRHLVVTDANMTEPTVASLRESLFQEFEGSWHKVVLAGTFSVEQLWQELQRVEKGCGELGLFGGLNLQTHQLSISQDPVLGIKLERMLWPAKINDIDVPCYVVPIRPTWARDLFDEALGRDTLFGSNTSLLFRLENVFYRSANTRLPSAPSRILWYVSKGNGGNHSEVMAIRACSYVDDVQIATPKELFSKLGRLGVYQWQQVLATAHNDYHSKVLAFRFGMTEQFHFPVPLDTVKTILKRNTAPQSPIRISPSEFLEIYHMGMRAS